MHRGHALACASALAPSLFHLLMTTACVVRDGIVFLESLPLLYSDSCQSIVVLEILETSACSHVCVRLGIARLGGMARLGRIARLGGIAQFGSAGVTRSHYSRSRSLLSDA